MTKILLMNGPPHSGKDEAARLLQPYGWKRYAFADDLKDRFERAFGYTKRPEGWAKETPMPCPFQNITYRQGLIGFSEQYMKLLFGEDIFGRILREAILASRPEKVIISDSGFLEEALPIINTFGEENCLQIKLFRQGCSFAGDSRGYWTSPDCEQAIIHNDSTLENYKNLLLELAHD